jgi:hypothetical protein
MLFNSLNGEIMSFYSKLIFTAIMVLGPKAAFARDWDLARNCEARLLFQQIAEEKLGYMPTFKTEKLLPFTKEPGAVRYMISAVHPRFGMVIAFSDYTLSEDGLTLELEKSDVLNANNFRRGLSNVLFAEIVEQQPQASKIIATLSDVNLRAFEAAGGDCNHSLAETPVGKAAAHFGFVHVIPLECNPATREYKFAITREVPH